MELLRHSPLEASHLALGAKLTNFAGWQMPIQYTSIMDEHAAVRNAVGVFDISHMGQFIVSGSGACAWLDGMLTNAVASLAVGEGQYTLLLNERGGVIDDLILYRWLEDTYFLVVNASKIDEDFTWLSQHLAAGVLLRNESDAWAGLAVQGPLAASLYQKIYPHELLPPRNGIHALASGEIVCRTGYTGEDGFEIFIPVGHAASVWQAMLDGGAKPCALGARDTLRLEMGYPLNGNDLSPDRTPLEAGLGFFCDLTKNDFIGREVLLQQKSEGLSVRLTAIETIEKGPPPRAHYPVLASDGTQLGELSSGVLSPTLMAGIGMAYLPTAFSKIGTSLFVEVRGKKIAAKVVKKPFLTSHRSQSTTPTPL